MDTHTKSVTEEDAQRSRDKKLPIDVLVTIGDSLHDSRASFILALDRDCHEIGGGEITFASHGSTKQLVTMLKEFFNLNPEYVEVFLEAIVRSKMEHHLKNYGKDF